MLLSLSVKNFALIKQLEVNFCNNLNVITGETGAGKSVLISAINFALGGRADKNNIRTGASEAFVQIVFDITGKEKILEKLTELGIERDENIIISRRLSVDNKNEIRVNGQIVNLTILKSLTTLLIDIYGQHEHQALLNVAMHIEFLDSFIGEELLPYKQKLKELIGLKNEIEQKIKSLGGDKLSQEREKEMLQFQIEEIENANLKLGEDAELESKKTKFDNVQKVVSAVQLACDLLTDSNLGSANTNLYNAEKSISNLGNIDKEFDDLSSRINSAYIEIEDIAETLKDKVSEYNFSELEYDEIDRRLDFIKKLKKKYGSEISEILQFLEDSKQRLVELIDSEDLLNELQDKLQKTQTLILNECSAISKIRCAKAKILSENIICELNQLGIKNSRFEVSFKQVEPMQNGNDEVEFMFSANVGEPLKPLAKVISGGEMSRFMLAFKIVLGSTQEVETLIFDEIDNGISGVVSYEVGKKLARLARNTQIITVTHLATIASFADRHFLISKEVLDGHTYSGLNQLDYEGEIKEIARLAGGNQSKLGLAHAKELKKQSQDFIIAIK